MPEWGVWYLIGVSAVAATVTVADKIAAIRHRWRVPERTLFLLAAIGGSAAMLATMLLIRHKTAKRRFMIGIPMIIAAQAALWWYLR